MMIFLRCVGEALVARGMRGLMGLIPYGEQAESEVRQVASWVCAAWRAAVRPGRRPWLKL
jgi:hypothetical protein